MKHEPDLISESRRLMALGRPHGPYHSHKACAASSAFRFTTWVDNDLRTEGVVLDSPGRSALDLDGFNLDLLAVAAASNRKASASGKLLIIGKDGVAMHQLHAGRSPAVAFCGQATLAVASVTGRCQVAFDVAGPDGRHVRVLQHRTDTYTKQWWHIAKFPVTQSIWRGRMVAHCPALNDYAIIAGLPPSVSAAEARRELFEVDALTNKLAIVERQASGPPRVTTETAAGTHGAIPATCAATLAALAGRSVCFADIFEDGVIKYPTKAGDAEMVLPEVKDHDEGGTTIALPGADVILSQLVEVY